MDEIHSKYVRNRSATTLYNQVKVFKKLPFGVVLLWMYQQNLQLDKP